MRYWCLTLVLFTSLALSHPFALAQGMPAANPKPDDKAAPPVAAASVGPDAPVIMIDGLCGSDLTSMMQPTARSNAPGSKADVPSGTKDSAAAVKTGCRT